VTLPTAKELLGADYDAQKSYKLAFENGFSETTDINGDITIKIEPSSYDDMAANQQTIDLQDGAAGDPLNKMLKIAKFFIQNLSKRNLTFFHLFTKSG